MATVPLFIKRFVDVVTASIGLLGTSPLMLLVSVLIFLEDQGPIFYRQRRVGLDLKEFDILKFRSMRVHNLSVEAVGQVTESHPLVTRVGSVIRRFKIDELPQLLNVLRGELSLVGPRPTVIEQVKLYDDFQMRRLSVRPGMTGWAQINGNVHLSWDERIALDVWYVDHWSLWLDLKILLRTTSVVLVGERPNKEVLEEALNYAFRAYRRG